MKTLIYGSIYAGKSWGMSKFIVEQCLQSKINVLVIRRVKASIWESVFALIQSHCPDNIKINKFNFNIKFPNGSIIKFDNKYSEADIIWVEEATEFAQDPIKNNKNKVYYTFNPPPTKIKWLEKLRMNPKVKIEHKHYKENPKVNQDLEKELNDILLTDMNYYKRYALGVWL